MSRRGSLFTTKKYREERMWKCQAYLREAGSLKAAQKLAKKQEGFSANTSVWITALGKMLVEKR